MDKLWILISLLYQGRSSLLKIADGIVVVFQFEVALA